MVDLSFVPEFATRSTSIRKRLLARLTKTIEPSQLARDLMVVKRALACVTDDTVGLGDVARGLIPPGPRLESVMLAISRELPASPGSCWQRPQARIARYEEADQRDRRDICTAVEVAVRREMPVTLRLIHRRG